MFDRTLEIAWRCAVGHRRATPMHSIALATQKGGSGKSTLAIGLAVAALEDGHRVGMIEADPQGTLASWGRRRTDPKPRIEHAGDGAEIARAIRNLQRDGFTAAVLDTPDTDNAVSFRGIDVSDLLSFPLRHTSISIMHTH